ncbi:MAG TPA: hypothetical protein DCQ84_14975, partial [Candidatus Competibacteraceae bacterium]|nr:hypothetical protein [Candidatus Competibacteraceae bacterium]
ERDEAGEVVIAGKDRGMAEEADRLGAFGLGQVGIAGALPDTFNEKVELGSPGGFRCEGGKLGTAFEKS